LLRSFINQYRDSNERHDLVAVGSAIRKLVVMPGADLSELAALLEAGHRGSIALDVELEIAKTIVRKLAAHPPGTPGTQPELEERLMDLARLYLHDRLLPRDKYAAAALNVVLAIVLLGGPQVPEVTERLLRVRLSWFCELVARRAARLRDELPSRFPPEDMREIVGRLSQLVTGIEQALQGRVHASAAS
jgi:hypothetical protein